MNLSEAVARYVAHRQSLGMRFCRQASTLKSFCRKHGETDIDQVESERVLEFIAGTGPITLNWRNKYDTLRGLYRFLVARGYTTCDPLPSVVPKPSISFVPHIFSRDELKRLLQAVDTCQSPRRLLEGGTLRALLLLLYGAALRLNEALALTLADVDMTEQTLLIRESKFYKTRLVPIDTDLRGVLAAHLAIRHQQRPTSDAPLFVTRAGGPVPDHLVQAAFRRLRIAAKVLRQDQIPQQPRLHDLRHSAAVHRLVHWYRSGADVQRMLPKLATFLGHVDVASTQRYLTLIPELLNEAGARFERYAMGDRHE
ncbi:MAG: tyrosine-type recombinase/integrase [Burkholderiales bacterium]